MGTKTLTRTCWRISTLLSSKLPWHGNNHLPLISQQRQSPWTRKTCSQNQKSHSSCEQACPFFNNPTSTCLRSKMSERVHVCPSQFLFFSTCLCWPTNIQKSILFLMKHEAAISYCTGWNRQF